MDGQSSIKTGTIAVKLQVLFAFLFLFIVGCASSIKNQDDTCDKERTNLDDVCVKDEIADYVSCVRAQGALLGKEQSQSLSVEIGSFAANAVAARDVSEKLDKKYTASNEAVMAIIRQCNILAGIVEISDYRRLRKNSVSSVLSTNQNSLAGEWKATGYICNGDIPEEIIIITLDNKKIEAKKIKGDDCIRSGEVTFTAILTEGIPGTFPAKLNVTDKPNSTKRWFIDALVEIVSSSEMYVVYDGIKISYRKIEM